MEPHVARRLLAAMPKAELHLHLDGSLRVETALELARTRGLDAPRDFAGMFAALCPGKGRLTSQAELLRSFELPVALLQDAEALERVTRELVESKIADNVRYLEIKWAPALHTARGLSLDDVVAAVASGARGVRAPGAVVSLTAVAVRSHDSDANMEVALAAERGEVDGFDLAGLEAEFPDPREHRRAFEAARAGGLHITVHAGEIHDGGASVRQALELKPERIAHGVSAANDAALCAELIERGVTLDLCPTSNVQAASIESLEQHPIARLHRQGVPVSLSTDDATISDVSLSEELLAAHTVIGLALPELWQMNLHALQVGFGDERRRAALHDEFVRWGSVVPELAGQHEATRSPTTARHDAIGSIDSTSSAAERSSGLGRPRSIRCRRAVRFCRRRRARARGRVVPPGPRPRDGHLPRTRDGPAAAPRRRGGRRQDRGREDPRADPRAELIRLQCYEGIDAAQALYEWDYSRQLLYARALQSGELAAARPRRRALRPRVPARAAAAARDPRRAPAAVLLIDELDRADDEFEAFLLEVLSDYTVTVPELGTIAADAPPPVVITSNRTRELHDALKRRCLYHWIDFPDLEREVEIVRLRAPGVSEPLARSVASHGGAAARLDLVKRPGSPRRSTGRRRCRCSARRSVDGAAARETLGWAVKNRDDLRRVRGGAARVARVS